MVSVPHTGDRGAIGAARSPRRCPLVGRFSRSGRPAPTPGFASFPQRADGAIQMHLMETLLVVLGAWLLLGIPVALFVGRFLSISRQSPSGSVRHSPNDSFGTAA